MRGLAPSIMKLQRLIVYPGREGMNGPGLGAVDT